MESDEKDIEMGNVETKERSVQKETNGEQGRTGYLCCSEDEGGMTTLRPPRLFAIPKTIDAQLTKMTSEIMKTICVKLDLVSKIAIMILWITIK